MLTFKVLEGLLASRASILASLEELSVRAQKGSVVVVYYSGRMAIALILNKLAILMKA